MYRRTRARPSWVNAWVKGTTASLSWECPSNSMAGKQLSRFGSFTDLRALLNCLSNAIAEPLNATKYTLKIKAILGMLEPGRRGDRALLYIRTRARAKKNWL